MFFYGNTQFSTRAMGSGALRFGGKTFERKPSQLPSQHSLGGGCGPALFRIQSEAESESRCPLAEAVTGAVPGLCVWGSSRPELGGRAGMSIFHFRSF